jgi:hypothetical protein
LERVHSAIGFCLSNHEYLEPWAVRFLQGLSKWPLAFHGGQLITLDGIEDKIRAARAS